MFRALFVIAFTLLLGACQPSRSWVSEVPQKSGPCPDEPGGWCDFTRAAASRAWLYALLSNNVYERYQWQYALPEYVKRRSNSPNDGIGFSYSIYDISNDGRLVEVVVAFRGTERLSNGGLKDWFWGNISGAQNKRGLEALRNVFDDLRDRGQSNVEVTVTGHSLGGGIAHHVSLREIELSDGTKRAVTRSVVFNNSPRYWRRGGTPEVDRLAIVEYGEVLKILRLPARSPTQRYISLNCRPSGLNAAKDHSMYYLAGCLNWIAAFDESAQEARKSLARNPAIERPASQTKDDDPRLEG